MGSAKKVIPVGAVEDNDKIASFFPWGSTSDDRLKHDLCAVGVDISAAKVNSARGYTHGVEHKWRHQKLHAPRHSYCNAIQAFALLK